MWFKKSAGELEDFARDARIRQLVATESLGIR